MLTLSPLLKRFAERTPLPVMARGLLEHHLCGEELDSWFKSVAEKQYAKELFSDLYDLMTQVVFRHQPAVNAAYQSAAQPLGASLAAVYEKLNNGDQCEPGQSECPEVGTHMIPCEDAYTQERGGTGQARPQRGEHGVFVDADTRGKGKCRGTGGVVPHYGCLSELRAFEGESGGFA